MAASKNKRQHFVPQHYLRHFCEDGQIGVATTEPFRYVGKDTTRNQCQANYFYRQGEDNSVDDWLWEVEANGAWILTQVAESKKMTDEELVALRMLAVIFLLRTRKAAEVAKLLPKWHADIILKDAIDRGELSLPPGGWRPGLMDFEGASGMLLRNSLIPAWLEMQTLWQKFLVPRDGSAKRFITSDHPVVRLNPFLEPEQSERGFAGFSRPGFQLFFPLSPECCVMFYDAGVYKVGGKRENVVSLSDYDMDQVNGLQVQSADKVLLFHPESGEPEIDRLFNFFGRFRRPLEEHLHRTEMEQGDEVTEFVITKSTTTVLPKPFEFCTTVRHPRVGVDGRRNQAWTEFSKIVIEEFEKDPGDIDGAMKRAEARI